jgi:hypothetical protein
MRALVAAALALSILLGVGAPHFHANGQGEASCAVCVLRHTDVPRADGPDVSPRVHTTAAVVVIPGLPPVDGAPLGAVPGQSPPPAAA